MPERDITRLLQRAQRGDQSAEERLVSIVFQELRRLAVHYMRREQRPDHILQPTTLVNEAYVRLVRFPEISWESRTQFFGVAARLMREILVDQARAHLARKRGGELPKLSLDELKVYSPAKTAGLVALDEALDRTGPRKKMRAFPRHPGWREFCQSRSSVRIYIRRLSGTVPYIAAQQNAIYHGNRAQPQILISQTGWSLERISSERFSDHTDAAL
jgi:RNA polymerase sigma factor (TIGR02999 family)